MGASQLIVQERDTPSSALVQPVRFARDSALERQITQQLEDGDLAGAWPHARTYVQQTLLALAPDAAVTLLRRCAASPEVERDLSLWMLMVQAGRRATHFGPPHPSFDEAMSTLARHVQAERAWDVWHAARAIRIEQLSNSDARAALEQLSDLLDTFGRAPHGNAARLLVEWMALIVQMRADRYFDAVGHGVLTLQLVDEVFPDCAERIYTRAAVQTAMAACELRLGQLDRAEELARQAEEGWHTISDAFHERGTRILLADLVRHRGAANQARRMLDSLAWTGNVCLDWARLLAEAECLNALGDYEQALLTLEQALGLAPCTRLPRPTAETLAALCLTSLAQSNVDERASAKLVLHHAQALLDVAHETGWIEGEFVAHAAAALALARRADPTARDRYVTARELEPLVHAPEWRLQGRMLLAACLARWEPASQPVEALRRLRRWARDRHFTKQYFQRAAMLPETASLLSRQRQVPAWVPAHPVPVASANGHGRM